MEIPKVGYEANELLKRKLIQNPEILAEVYEKIQTENPIIFQWLNSTPDPDDEFKLWKAVVIYELFRIQIELDKNPQRHSKN